MKVIDSKEMLKDAQKYKYAIGAFNVENMEMIKAVIDTAYLYKAPVIIASSTNALKYVEPIVISKNVDAFLQDKPIPVALHLDHGSEIELISKCLKAGYSSIMFDGSHFTFGENVKFTKEVVDLCHHFEVPVEGELGAIGGKADAVNIDLAYTNPLIAADFVDKTNVDSLAVAIGTAHGIYKSTPKLDYDRCNEIRNALAIPLVLHGASGLSHEQVRSCIDSGISKVNYATELRMAYSKAIREYLNQNPKEYDPKKYGNKAIDAVSEVVLEKLITTNSIGRAMNINPKLIVFDFDGVIVDSEKIYVANWIKAAGDCGFELSYTDALKLRSCDSLIAREVFGDEALYNSVRAKRKEYMSIYNSSNYFDLKPFISETLKKLNGMGYKIIIASSSTGDIIKRHLEHYDLNKYISEILSVKDISRGKPYPDIYVNICNHYNFHPSDVLAIEDSPNGIASAHSAGCKVVMIKDLSLPNKEEQKNVDVLLPDASYLINIFN